MNRAFDYVVIGAGSAGSVLAGRLSQDPAVRVALLESGPPDASVAIHCPAGLALLPRLPHLTRFYNTVPQPGLNGRWGHGFSVHVCALQPRSRGTVRLQSANPHEAPLVDPQFLSDPHDAHTLVQGVKAARHIMAQTSLARYGQEWARSSGFQTDAEIEQWVRNHTDTIYHPVGTCRMGTDPEAVVDTQCRVHGLQGLRVVDASVMPRIVSGNTNAPTIMLAERVAAWLQKEHA